MDPHGFTHLDTQGQARMVDVGDKPIQHRQARACATLWCAPDTLRRLRDDALPTGDVLATARIAGIQAAKRTAELIPLCHVLPLESVAVHFTQGPDHIRIEATASTHARTGVEMEALAAASIAALTLYDMMKAVDKGMRIDDLRLLEKTKS